jgi:hypothetical protein
MGNMRVAYDEVYVYAMERPGFILQHVVDAFAVETASSDTKAISVVFGLIGLYLHVEKQFSGRPGAKSTHGARTEKTRVAEAVFAGGSG